MTEMPGRVLTLDSGSRRMSYVDLLGWPSSRECLSGGGEGPR